MFDELRKTPFHLRKRKQGHVVEVKDGGLLGFPAFMDLQISLEEGAQAEVPLNIQDCGLSPRGQLVTLVWGCVWGWVGG